MRASVLTLLKDQNGPHKSETEKIIGVHIIDVVGLI